MLLNLIRRLMTRAFRVRPTAPIRRPAPTPGLRVEGLEGRVVPAVVYADDSLVADNTLASLGGRVTIDRDSSNTLTAGDQVTFALGEPGETTSLTFGQAAVGGDGGTAFGTGSSPGAIQASIDFASAGDTVHVARGLYTLSTGITVNKALTILGPQAGVDARPSAGTTRVIGSTNEAVIDVNGLSQGFVIAASDVTIDGFDVRNATTDLIDSQGSTAFSNAAIRNNIIHNATVSGGAKGIRLTAVSNSTVEYNNVFTVADAGVEIGSSSLTLVSANAVVQYNEVHDLGSAGTTNSALYAFSSPSSTDATTDLNVTFRGNLVYNHFGNDAIKVGSKGSTGPDRNILGGMVVDNVVHDVAQDGITINAKNTSVLRNEVHHSFTTNGAIYVEHAASCLTVENNFLHDNSAGQAAILIGFSGKPASPTGMVARFNSIVNNTNNFIFFRDNTAGTATLDASANWFGSSAQANVTASVKSTAGAVATTNRIDFTPWLNNGLDADAMTPGFQPNVLGLTVAPSTVSLQTGGGGRINEAVGLAATGATIDVIDGTYIENVSVNKDVTVNVSGTVTGKVGSTTEGKIVATGTLSLGDNSGTGVGLDGSLAVGSQSVTLLDSATAVLAGATTIAGGTLTAANGIGVGASLSGTGTVLSTVDTAGIVLPGGSSLGTLSTGSISFANGSTFAVDVNGAAADQMAVNGGVSIGGATLSVTLAAAPAVGQSFTIISNDAVDAVSGTFAGLPEGAFVSSGGASFQITYTGGSNGNDVVLTTVVGVTITANDASAAETASPAPANPGQFTVTRSGPTGAPLTIFYSVSGTATNGTDYATLSGSVTIPTGQPSAVIDVAVINDASTELPESVVLTLIADPSYALAKRTSAFVVISDNEPEVSITANDGSASETVSPAAANPGQFTVTRTGDSSADLTVFYSVVGSAAAGSDYVALSGSVTILAGQSSAVIDVAVINDASTELPESVFLTLSADAAYTLADPISAFVIISDNEPEVSITANDGSASETVSPAAANPGQFTVTRTGDSSADLTVFYSVSGTATNGADYATLTGSVTIPTGQSSAVIDVSVLNDAITELPESVVLTLIATRPTRWPTPPAPSSSSATTSRR